MSARRTLIAALSTVAIAAPAATAAQPPDMHASTAIAAAEERQQVHQDLRSPDARHAALLAKQRDSAKPALAQDLRSPDAVDAALHPRKTLTVDAPGATVNDSQTTRSPAPASVKATGDDGVDWTTVGIGIAGSLLVLGGIAALTARVRATPRTGVSA
jgi:hypothetical protein